MFRLIFIVFLFFSANVNAQSKLLKAIVPHHIKAQYAGGIGWLSIGAGYETNNKKIQADLMYGYVPEEYSVVPIHSITAKFTWLPLGRNYNKFRIDYLTTGVLANYAFGDQYFGFDPDNYPYEYYGFPTAFHAAMFVGGAVSYKKAGLYYEVGITDRQIINYVQNSSSMLLQDVVNMGIGLRVAL